MPCNIDHDPCIATRGLRVRFKSCQLMDDAPESWLGIGTVLGLQKDPVLTQMNKKNMTVYRILIDFGDETPASVLPSIIERR
jgi:hypothetical protein